MFVVLLYESTVFLRDALLVFLQGAEVCVSSHGGEIVLPCDVLV
jgi:hypothetical protein